MGDTADRTIPATPRRREAARRQGLMPAAALPAWAAAAGVTILLLPAWARATIPAAAEMLRAAVRDAAGPGGQPLTAALLLPTVALVLAAAAAALTVRGVCDGFSWQPGRALPDPGRIDPRAGLARIFSAATLASVAGQGLALVLLVAVAWAALAPLVGTGAEALREPQTALDRAGRAAAWSAAAAAAVAAAHWALARRRFEQRLRMTPQEFADEARGLQADPKVRLLQRRRAASAARAQAAGGRSAAGAA